MHRRNTSCILSCQPIQPLSDRGQFLMHRRSTSCISSCQADSTILRPQAVFYAQTQFSVHSELPDPFNYSPTAGKFFMHRRNTSCIISCQTYSTIIRPRAIFMHRRSTSCILSCQTYSTILREPFFMHRRSTSCILSCQTYSTILRPRANFDAQAQYFVHSELPNLFNHSPTAGHFLCTSAVLRRSELPNLFNHSPTAGHFLFTGAVLRAF
jgi:hypothetical protein